MNLSQLSLGMKMGSELKQIKRSGEKHCSFCRKSELNDETWGEMYELGDITVHYFCMLFSSALTQEGKDHEGILGFLPSDLKKEIRRGEKLKCKFCKGRGATIGCSLKQCKTSFHFSCGLTHGTLHQFSNNYASFCSIHKPESNIPSDLYESECLLCCCTVSSDEPAVWTPCCKKFIFHRTCMQKHASAAGLHHFSCPNCRERDKFVKAMQDSGVYVPDRDAKWETDGDFAHLEDVYAHCDAKKCLCPHGREHDTFKEKNEVHRWEIIRCNVCASKAVHFQCGNLKYLKWKCKDCADFLCKVGSTNSSVSILESETSIVGRHFSADDSVSSDGDSWNSNRSKINKICNPVDFISNRTHVVEEEKKTTTTTFSNFKKTVCTNSTAGAPSSKSHNSEKSGSSSSTLRSLFGGRVNSAPSVDVTLLEKIDRNPNVTENFKNVLKRYLDEKNVDTSERKSKIFVSGVQLPQINEIPSGEPLREKEATSGKTGRAVPKTSEKRPSSLVSTGSKEAVMSDLLKESLLQKFRQGIAKTKLENNKSTSFKKHFSKSSYGLKQSKSVVKINSFSSETKNTFPFEYSNVEEKPPVEPYARSAFAYRTGSNTSEASLNHSSTVSFQSRSLSPVVVTEDDDSDIEVIMEWKPSSAGQISTKSKRDVDVVHILLSDDECDDADIKLLSPPRTKEPGIRSVPEINVALTGVCSDSLPVPKSLEIESFPQRANSGPIDAISESTSDDEGMSCSSEDQENSDGTGKLLGVEESEDNSCDMELDQPDNPSLGNGLGSTPPPNEFRFFQNNIKVDEALMRNQIGISSAERIMTGLKLV